MNLDINACRQRQTRLRQHLTEAQLDAALIMGPRHVHYFSGFWRPGRVLTPVALLVSVEGRTTLVTPSSPDDTFAVDSVSLYEADKIATLIDDPHAELFQALRPHLTGIQALGTDNVPHPLPLDISESRDIAPLLLALRRIKDPDEVAMLQTGIHGCDAAYAWAKEHLEPGITEVSLYAGMLAAATEALGEAPTEFGNDFQCGALGSLPRPRPVQSGEMAIFDVGVVYRGYSSDLCRTFVVGRQLTENQTAAYQRVMQALEYVEATVRPGVSCKQVYEEVHTMIDGFRGWKFAHHLGHGIGLAAHEAPRLNPFYDDTFQVGDVFTAEPGLYGGDLRAGIRIEQDYLVTPEGLRRLSQFPTDLS